MKMSKKTFLSYVMSYLGAYCQATRLTLYTGNLPTQAELDTRLPYSRPNKLITFTSIGTPPGGSSTFKAIPSSDNETISIERSVPDALFGPALMSGTVTHAIYSNADDSPQRFIVVPVGTAQNPEVLNLNKLTFSQGEQIQVISFSHILKRSLL